MKINDRILVFNIPYVYIYMSDKEIDEKLRAIYYGPNVNTSSAKRLYQAARGKGLKVTMPQVNAFITKQAAFQKTKTFTATKKLFSSIIAPRPGAGLQADLMELRGKYKIKGQGKKKYYLLNVVDIHSRKAWSELLTRKLSDMVTPAMEGIIKKITADQKDYRGLKDAKKDVQIVRNLNTDEGSEFISEEFQEMLSNLKINQYTSDPKDYAKNALVERFNRTIRGIMMADKAQRDNKPFTEADIERYVRNYNQDIHSTIKAKPEDVYQLKDKNKQKYTFIQFKLGKGDKVRTLDKKALFDKGTYEYSDKVYTIKAKDKNRYELDGVKKKYLGYELMLVSGVQNSPDYDFIEANANRISEIRDEEQDRTERRITKDLGEPMERAPLTRTRLREVDDAPSEGEYEVEKILKRRKKNGRYEYRLKWKGSDEVSWEPRSSFPNPQVYMDYDKLVN